MRSRMTFGGARAWGRALTLANTVATACVLALGAGGLWALAQAEDKEPERLHGALPMDQQRSKVDKLLAGKTKVEVPRGVSPTFFATLVDPENPGTEQQVALGKKLFFDLRLSKDGTVACATCHDASRGFTDHRPLFEGVGGQVGRRNSPSVLNAVFFSRQFWDGRADSLEAQAALPITNPIEMGQPSIQAAVAAIGGDAAYQKEFRTAYGRELNFLDITRAIAAYERTLIFLDAPFDRFVAGDAKAISDDARAGWALFNGKARCTACHQLSSGSPIGTDNRFHNIGVSARHQDFETLATKALATLAADDSKEKQDRLALETDFGELGRFVVTKNRSDVGSFKTQQIRNIGISAPYMHDGSLATLWDVMDHYNKGGEANPYLDGGIEPLALSEQEIDRVVAFLFTLTDDRLVDQNDAELTRQKGLADKQRPFRDNDLANRKVYTFERRLAEGRGAPAHERTEKGK